MYMKTELREDAMISQILKPIWMSRNSGNTGAGYTLSTGKAGEHMTEDSVSLTNDGSKQERLKEEAGGWGFLWVAGRMEINHVSQRAFGSNTRPAVSLFQFKPPHKTHLQWEELLHI